MLRSCNRILCKLIGKNRQRKQEEHVSESTLEQTDSFSDDSCDADSDDEFDNDNVDGEEVDDDENGYNEVDHTNIKPDNDVNYSCEKFVNDDDDDDDGGGIKEEEEEEDDDKRYSDVCNIMEYKLVEKSKVKCDPDSPSPEQDGETYEVPDFPPQAPPPIIRKPPALPSPSESDSDEGGEVYDELEGIAEDKQQPKPQFKPKPPPLPQDFQGEIYDECDVKEQDAATGGELYEDPEINPSDNAEGGGEIYEVPDEANMPKPNTLSRHDAPVPPPPPGQRPPPPPPTTSSLPAPVPSRSTGQTATKLETVRKMSGEGAPGMGISLDVLGQGRARLRKVENTQDPEKEKGSLAEDAGDRTSVKDKISLFKAAESDSNDEDSNSNSLKDQLNSARKSLRKKSPVPNSADNNTYFTQSKTSANSPPIDSSKLSISERIALMNGKNMGGIAIVSTPSAKPKPVSSKTDFKNDLKPVSGNKWSLKPPTPVKPAGLSSGRLSPSATAKSPVNQVPSTQPKVQPTPSSYLEEIYDDAINVLPVDPLSNEVWYHGERDRKECEKDLTTKGKDGSFMVRKSTKGGDTQPYTLVVLYKSHVYNLRIRKRPDNKIALGNEKEAEQELAFDSVPELIEHHTSNEVILINNSENRQYKALLKDALHMR